MKQESSSVERVIGLDGHPDTFTAALICGQTPASAIVEKTYNRIPMGRLVQWAIKNSAPQDLIVLEASGNSFQIARTLRAAGRRAKVLESCQMGKLKEAHANNDKISAIRVGKAYLAGTAKEVWVPDAKTQERRDWLYAHRKAVKRTTQMRARLRSYLSDNGVRLKKGTKLSQPAAQAQIQGLRSWSAGQWQVIEIFLLDLRQAEQQRKRWHSLITQEVLADPLLLSMVRLCGVREIVAFAVGAFVGNVQRFANAKKLVKYAGLNPAFDDSGQGQWSGGVGGHGNKYLRGLLTEAAQSILRSPKTPTAQWGKKLLRRKGKKNLVIAAMARKLTVAIWYLLAGRWTALEEIDKPLSLKVGKMLDAVGPAPLKRLRIKRKAYRQQIYQQLKGGRTYVLDPNKKFTPNPKANLTLAQEYGLS